MLVQRNLFGWIVYKLQLRKINIVFALRLTSKFGFVFTFFIKSKFCVIWISFSMKSQKTQHLLIFLYIDILQQSIVPDQRCQQTKWKFLAIRIGTFALFTGCISSWTAWSDVGWYVRGRSNNTLHFFWHFLPPPQNFQSLQKKINPIREFSGYAHTWSNSYFKFPLFCEFLQFSYYFNKKVSN